jgi:N-acetylglucosaminyl-diphospho-decaprenol L-rhamnosyltransferase
MWSTFYFYKKNYGFFYALKKTKGKLLRSFVKMIYYYFIFNKVLKAKYTCRLMGLLNSIFGKKSWYRVNSQYQ